MDIIKKWLAWPFIVIGFQFFYIYEIIISNLKLAHDVITPTDYFKDTLQDYKAPLTNRFQVALLMNLITMTPGTIAVNYNRETFIMTVHFMFEDDVPDFRKKLEKVYIPFVRAVLPWG